MNTTNTIKIGNQTELVGYLKSLGTECRFISMITDTEVKMRKTGNPYLGARKVSKRNGLVNVNYVKAVEKRLTELNGEKTTYEAGTTWYIHVLTTEGKPLPLCTHKNDANRYYLQYFPHRSHSKYYFNGKEIKYELLQPFINEREEDELKPRVVVFKMESIINIKFRKINATQLSTKIVDKFIDSQKISAK